MSKVKLVGGSLPFVAPFISTPLENYLRDNYKGSLYFYASEVEADRDFISASTEDKLGYRIEENADKSFIRISPLKGTDDLINENGDPDVTAVLFGFNKSAS